MKPEKNRGDVSNGLYIFVSKINIIFLGSETMYKKILSILLSSVLFCGGFVSADVIESFDNVQEKIGYIISSDKVFDLTDCETTTYNDFVFENELNIKTVSISRTQAKTLSGNYVIEEDFTVKAETFESNVTDEELYEDENLNSYVSEGYTWNIPFVNGTESDLGTLGDENIKVGILDSGISNSDEFENVTRVDLVPDTVNDSLVFILMLRVTEQIPREL